MSKVWVLGSAGVRIGRRRERRPFGVEGEVPWVYRPFVPATVDRGLANAALDVPRQLHQARPELTESVNRRTIVGG